MYGLNCEVDISEVEEELKTKLPSVSKIYKMNTQHRPLYLVITDNKTKIHDIQLAIKSVCYCRVSFKKHTNKKEIIQCHRCQRWGHATTNCHMPVKCLKCAQNHLTSQCTKSPDTGAKCTNCNGAHAANSIECEAYQRRLSAKHKGDYKFKCIWHTELQDLGIVIKEN